MIDARAELGRLRRANIEHLKEALAEAPTDDEVLEAEDETDDAWLTEQEKADRAMEPGPTPEEIQLADLLKEMVRLGYALTGNVSNGWVSNIGKTKANEVTVGQVQWIYHNLHTQWMYHVEEYPRVDGKDMKTYRKENVPTDASPRFLSWWDNFLHTFEADWNDKEPIPRGDHRLLLINDCIHVLAYQWAWQERELAKKGQGFRFIKFATLVRPVPPPTSPVTAPLPRLAPPQVARMKETARKKV
jgi:hypothetical protein